MTVGFTIITFVSFAFDVFTLVVGRFRFFRSVSVFGFLVGFFFSRFGFRFRFFKNRGFGSVFGFFHSNCSLLVCGLGIVFSSFLRCSRVPTVSTT